jgi:hypothetical protein
MTLKKEYGIWKTDYKYASIPSFIKWLRFIKVPFKALGVKNTLYSLFKRTNEDYIFSNYAAGSGHVNPKLPDEKVASTFAFEIFPSLLFRKNGDKLPFGCHAFEKYEYSSFWSKYIPNTIELPNFMKVSKTFPYLSSFLDIYGDRLEKEEPMLSNVVLSGSEEIPQNGGLTQDDSPFMVSPVKAQNNSFIIYRNKELCNNMGLTENEQYSLIAHEFGHIIFKIRGLTGNSEDEEVFADETAAKVVGKDETLSALIKLQELIKAISAKSDVWNFIGPKSSIDLVADIEARIAMNMNQNNLSNSYWKKV